MKSNYKVIGVTAGSSMDGLVIKNICYRGGAFNSFLVEKLNENEQGLEFQVPEPVEGSHCLWIFRHS